MKPTRLLSILLSMCLIITLTSACGSKDDSYSSKTDSGNQAVDDNTNENNDDSESYDTNTSVYKIVRKPYAYHPEEYNVSQIEAGSSSFVWVYNTENQVIGSYSFENASASRNIVRYEYNEQGYVSKRFESMNEKSKEMEYVYDYEYTDDNQISVMTVTYNGSYKGGINTGDISRLEYTYSDGLLQEITNNTIRDDNIIRTRHDEFTYDENGNMTEQRWYYENSPEWVYYAQFEYSNNKMTKGYYGTGDSIQNTYTFDENEDVINLSEGKYNVDYEYDSNGSLIRINDTTYNNDILKTDESGRLIL